MDYLSILISSAFPVSPMQYFMQLITFLGSYCSVLLCCYAFVKKWFLTMFLELPLLSKGKTCRRDGKKSLNIIANLAQPSCN